MYLTHPPTTEVIAHVSYRKSITEGSGLTGGLGIDADRAVYCETGVTVASLFDVLNMEGDVEITQREWWMRDPRHDHLVGLHKDTTISREIEDLIEFSDVFPGRMQLAHLETVIEFPSVVFREWRAESDYLSERQYQVTAEEALHG